MDYSLCIDVVIRDVVVALLLRKGKKSLEGLVRVRTEWMVCVKVKKKPSCSAGVWFRIITADL